jgi:predicted nucleotidyltransferase
MHSDIAIILQAITGSVAYGLATEHSDIDRHGIYLAPTRQLLGISPPEQTIVTTRPDSTFHEVGKFVLLATKANPTILEQLFLDRYEVLHPAGQLLIDHRHLFLSTRVRYSHGKYAMSQVRQLQARGDSFSSATRNRTAKHARHCFRLLQQGRQLLETGTLSVRVDNREELFAIGMLPVAQMVARFEAEYARFTAIATRLPEEPDLARINALLVTIRETYG